MGTVTYKQGMTTVWSDGEKVVIKNPSSFTHVEVNVDNIFGVGEFKKLWKVKYFESLKNNSNPHSKTYEMTTGYIPERVKLDLEEQNLPGIKQEDVVKDYFS